MKRLYIVTGTTGLIGNNLIRTLVNDNKVDHINCLINNTMPELENDKITYYEGNVCDIKSLDILFNTKGYDEKICIHSAGIITIATYNSEKIYDVNVNGTKNIVKMCKKYNIDKLIYISSVHATKELPKPEIIKETNEFFPDEIKGVYAKTKAEASNIVLKAAKNGLNATILQPSAIIGPYDYHIGNFTELINMYISGKLPAIVNGGYDFVDVRDVVDGIIMAVEKGRSGECYFLTNKYLTVKELLDDLSDVTKKNKVKHILPDWFMFVTAPIAEVYSRILKQKPLFTPYSIHVLKTNSNFSHEKATKELGYNPRDIKETLEDTYKWILNK